MINLGNRKNLAKPVLRWAGGKNWLVKHLEELIGHLDFNNYIEPFLGGASIFLALNPKGKSYLSDLNSDLIDAYKAIKKYPHEIISELRNYKNNENFYYKIRETEFSDQIQRAARFIYLNQTSFNGIYRVNLKGKYNVPYGFRSKNFLEEEKLIHVSRRLEKAKLLSGDFDKIKKFISKNDLIFLDPPYTVSHNHNGFIKYNQKLFSLDDQYRLSELVDYIKSKKAYYILTNADHEKIVEIFDKRDTLLIKNRASLIGGINAIRGQTSEFVFTNVI